GGIANSDRLGIFVAGQPFDFELRQTAFPVHAVENLHLRWTACDCSQEPSAPRTRFLCKTRTRQCEKREGRIAQPAVTIIPIAHAPYFFRQRSRRCRYNSAGGSIGQAFERDERAHYCVVPFAAVYAAFGPVSPIFLGVAQGMLGLDGARRFLMRRIPGQNKRSPLALRACKF